jgi:hypothetical protein
MNQISEMMWHDDGHQIELRINRSDIEVIDARCPGGKNRMCAHHEFDCIVNFFISVYGMDCNAGVCPASDKLDICWTFVGDKHNIEAGQLWFMPKTDEVFSAWLIAKKPS